jgi:hypothetical protein
MSTRQQRRDELVDDLVLPHHASPDLRRQGVPCLGELAEEGDVVAHLGRVRERGRS